MPSSVPQLEYHYTTGVFVLSIGCVWPCKTLFCTIDCTAYKVKGVFEIGSEIGDRIERLLDTALANARFLVTYIL